MSEPIDLASERERRRPLLGLLGQPQQFGGSVSIGGTVSLDGECNELIHWFEKAPGRCKCGQEEWLGDGTTTCDFGVYPVVPES